MSGAGLWTRVHEEEEARRHLDAGSLTRVVEEQPRRSDAGRRARDELPARMKWRSRHSNAGRVARVVTDASYPSRIFSLVGF